jgi:tetratricopeptide (TPR) repeat protein
VLAPFRAGGEDAPEVYYTLGRAFRGAGRYREAVDVLLKYLEHESSRVPAINLLGECYRKLGLPGEALKAYEASLKLAPEQQDIRTVVQTLREKR